MQFKRVNRQKTGVEKIFKIIYAPLKAQQKSKRTWK
jgi:hypothetical protein